MLHTLKADVVLADEEAQLDLEDRDTGLRELYALRQTRLDLEVRHSTKWIATCGNSNRLSLIATFYFLNFQAPIDWDRSGEQYHHRDVMSDSGIDSTDSWIDRNIVVQPDTEEGQGHYWAMSRRTAQMLYRGISDKDLNSRALFEMWQGIFRHYGINPSMYTCPSSLPPHTQFLIVAYPRLIQEWVIAYVRIKRPSALYGVAKCWEMARSELETEVRVSFFP